ncbi:EF-hand domain-containing protein [Hydrogenophaga pseudoflava]|uniref:EF-hand domain-containing protein n=1 Tax=Hydrogenophaga pseudoflava TaxID=47421 RepID=UPI0027E532D9|nr:EF-hand domain-containing protein [Hydrogenophaga pseudoflava]MDQ7744539.1 EF-hand domain-containing protein [Hydrogenophaga pseudoflava]
MSTVDTSNSSAWSQTLSSLSGAMSSYLQDKMHKKMDADGDGGVSQSEFQAALEKVAGKLGVDAGKGASELYASLDANKDGALNGSEVGTLLQNLFSSASNTQAFVQSRGDEARFAELDADNDGQISMAEFGITPATGTTVVQTTTVITTTQEIASDGATAPAGGSGSTTPVTAAPVHTASTPDDTTVVASAEDAAATEDASLQALMQTVDTDGSGDISSTELNAYVAKLSAQAEAASKRYNDTALASLGGGSLNESA